MIEMTAITVAITADVRNVFNAAKALSLSTDRPIDQLTFPSPLTGVKVTIRVCRWFDFAERAADGRRVLRVNILQVLCDQGFVRVNQDFAVATDQKGIAQAIKVQGIDGVRDGL